MTREEKGATRYRAMFRHYTIILKQFGGAGIGGTLEKYGP